jgi:hypothetical protein
LVLLALHVYTYIIMYSKKATYCDQFQSGDLVRLPTDEIGVVLFYSMPSTYEPASCQIYVGSDTGGRASWFRAQNLKKYLISHSATEELIQ